jgi:hypothetical protein
VLSRLSGSSLNSHVGIWQRKNYQSKDSILKAGINFTNQKFDASLTQQYIIEKNASGSTSKPLITDLTGGWFFSKEIMGTFGLEYAVDEKVTIVSGLVGIGLRLSSEQPTPSGLPPQPAETL